ncbi:hypothetical protein PRIC2_010642 [Phytophthora ramorum]
MVRVSVGRNLALVALCHSSLQSSSDSVSVVELDVEPMAFVTAAARSDSTPLWLVLPMLLDVQPVLLKVDVTRHVPAQVQSFCQEHKVNTTRCSGAIREALDEVVNFQRFCKKSTAESALPGFVVTKNVLRESGENASFLWVQNDPEDVAIDFCDFAGGNVGESDECTAALENVLRLSFDWILHLTPCEQQGGSGSDATSAESESASIGDRLATVEQMIAELQSPLVETTEQPPSVPEDQPNGASFHEEVGSDEENSTDIEEPPEDNVTATQQTDFSADITEAVPGLIPMADSDSISAIGVIDEPDVEETANCVNAVAQDQPTVEIAALQDTDNTEETISNLDTGSSGFEEIETSSLKMNEVVTTECEEANSGSCEADSEELIEFREIFNLVDRDRGGSITKVELGELMDTLGIDTSPEEIDLMINEIDQDSNGEIDFDEFVAVMSRKVNATYTSEQVKTAFKAFEGNASAPGFIKADKLLIALTTYGADRISSDQAQELISQLEPDQHGNINYVEYVNMMMSE